MVFAYLVVPVFIIYLTFQFDAKLNEQRGVEAEQTDPGLQREVASMNKMQFFQDQDTGLCFATGWRGSSRGGPMMTHIPCEAVKDPIPFWSSR